MHELSPRSSGVGRQPGLPPARGPLTFSALLPRQNKGILMADEVWARGAKNSPLRDWRRGRPSVGARQQPEDLNSEIERDYHVDLKVSATVPKRAHSDGRSLFFWIHFDGWLGGGPME